MTKKILFKYDKWRNLFLLELCNENFCESKEDVHILMEPLLSSQIKKGWNKILKRVGSIGCVINLKILNLINNSVSWLIGMQLAKYDIVQEGW